ncbi:hypothetical protein H4S08_004892 [Coemansia sp. RSA 1365]|nr:hypothetical protein H4S08_004892 [Coemansia sp. RSA 1365]
MTCPTQPSLQEAINLVRIHVESVQATYKHADTSMMVVAALEDLGSFGGVEAVRARKIKSSVPPMTSGQKRFEMLHQDALKRGLSSETFSSRAAKNECVMCGSSNHKASQCAECQGNAN